MSRLRSRVVIELKDGRRALAATSTPRRFLRWMLRRSARGKGFAINITWQGGTDMRIEPGEIKDFLVAAYEGPQFPATKDHT